MNRTTVRSLFIAATLVVTAAACGSDDSSSADTEAEAGTATTAPADTMAPADTAPADTTAPSDTEADAAAFPVTIEHKFGSTTIDAEPARVVSIGFNEHDFLLALGVVPVALRDWYGEQPNSVWPWAQDELGDATPEVLPSTDLNFEQIAALEPDLIVGVWSGITAEEYEVLSAIAPTVAQPDAYDDYGTPWQEQTMILGAATGRTAEAEAVVADVEGQIVAAREAHPEWEGQTSSVAFVTEEGPGAYASQDIRSRFMQDLGFVIPEVNDSDETNSFYMQLSAEDITALDVGVLVWVIGTTEALDGILNQLPTRQSLTAYAEGREIFADIELSGAFSHSSPLSLEYVLEHMVPEIEAAADGDPSTAVPSAVAVGAASEGSATPGASDDPADAAGAAWALVFDSTVPFADKAAHLADADELEPTVEAYAAAGSAMGGISLEPTAVAVAGETATVTYDVNFGANPAYTDQSGTIDLVDGVWVVSRDEFCAFMSSARTPCA